VSNSESKADGSLQGALPESKGFGKHEPEHALEYLTNPANRRNVVFDATGHSTRSRARGGEGTKMRKRTRELETEQREDHPSAASHVDGTEPQEAKDFFEQLTLLRPEDWQKGFTSYGYRIEPVLDKRDGQHYVFKVNESYDPDFVMRHWGSGKYLLLLNNPQGRTIARKTLSIHNLDHPPRVDLNELVASDPRNEKYFKTWGRPKEPMAPSGIQSTSTVDGVAVQEFARLNDKLLDLVQGRQNAPTLEAAQATPVVALVRELKGLFPQQPPADSLAVIDRVVSIADKLRPPPPPTTPAANPLGDIQGLVTLARDLKEIFQTEAAVEKTTVRSRLESWQEFTVALAPHLSQFLGPVSTLFAQVLAQKMLNGAPPAATAPSPVIPTPPQGQQPPDGQPASGPMMMPFLQMIAPPMVNYAREMAPPDNNDAESVGEDFAAWVWEGFAANPLYNDAIAAARLMGPAGLIAAFRSTPFWNDRGPSNLAPNLADLEQKLFGFFTAFLNWAPRPEDEDDEEEEDNEPLVMHTASETAPSPAS
jgi:hypothetical protein